MAKPRKNRWILLAAVAAFGVVVGLLGDRFSVSYKSTLTGCVSDNGTGGASGLYRSAQEIGFRVQTLDVSLEQAPQTFSNPTGNLLLSMGEKSLNPKNEATEPPTEEDPLDWSKIHQWISQGNTLVLVTSTLSSVPDWLSHSLERGEEEAPTGHYRVVRVEEPWLPSTIDDRPQTTEIEVKREAGIGSGKALTVLAGGPRARLKSGAKARSNDPSHIDAEPVSMASDNRGGVLFRAEVGKGSVYVLLDGYAWSNAGLDKGQNALVLAGILSREIKGGMLAFDEFRHGHGRSDSFLSYLLNSKGASTIIWLSIIWALLFYFGRNVRLQPAEAYTEPERRTAQEAINAVAQLYQRARAAPLVVEAVARRVRQVSRYATESPPDVAEALRQSEQYSQNNDRPTSPSSAMRMVERLIQLRKEHYGSRTIS